MKYLKNLTLAILIIAFSIFILVLNVIAVEDGTFGIVPACPDSPLCIPINSPIFNTSVGSAGDSFVTNFTIYKMF